MVLLRDQNFVPGFSGRNRRGGVYHGGGGLFPNLWYPLLTRRWTWQGDVYGDKATTAKGAKVRLLPTGGGTHRTAVVERTGRG